MVIVQLLAGLLAANVLWVVLYALGRLAIGSFRVTPAEAVADEYALELTASTGVGAAIAMFLLFVLGALGLFYPPFIISVIILALAAFAALSFRRSGNASAFSSQLFEPLSACRQLPWILTYLFALPTSILALLPPTWFDTTMYHFAHAIYWSQMGSLRLEPFLRYPLFSYNFELLFASFFALHLDKYVEFIPWLTFVLSTTGTYALAALVLQRSGVPRNWSQLGAVVASASLAIFPTAVEYADNGSIDLSAGFMFLAAIGATILAVRRPSPYTAAIAVIGGSFVGCKLALFFFTPLFLILLLYVGRSSSASRRSILLCALVFCSFAAPWYARNVALAGDPLSPILNMAFGRPDPIFTRADYDALLAATLHVGPLGLLIEPVTLYASGECPALDVVLLYVPFLAVAVLAFSRGRRAKEAIVLNGSVAYATLVTLGLAQITGRYLLQFYAAFIVALVVSLLLLAQWLRVNAPVLNSTRFNWPMVSALVALAVFAIPSPPGAIELAILKHSAASVPAALTDPDRYLRRQVTGYQEAQDVLKVMLFAHDDGRILAPQFENLAYYFLVKRHESVGDWFGPGRYRDLKHAIDSNAVQAYLKEFDIDGAMFFNDRGLRRPDASLTEDEIASLSSQFAKAGFVDYSRVGGDISEYVRSGTLARAAAVGLPTSVPRMSGRDSRSLPILPSFTTDAISEGSVPGSPTGRGVVVLTWPSDDERISSLTVISGYTYTVPNVELRAGAALSMLVAKPFPAGKAAVAWVDEISGAKRWRLFSLSCPPADGDEIKWREIRVRLRQDSHAALVFGAASSPGGGQADWIAFGTPTLYAAAFVRETHVASRALSASPAASVAGPGISFSVDPKPAPVDPASRTALVTVSWNDPAATRIQVRVNSSDGTLFADGAGAGSAKTGPWVTDGMRFYLQDITSGTPGRTVATVTATTCEHCGR